MEQQYEVDYHEVLIKYTINSGLGSKENYRYQQHIVGTISIENDEGKTYENIGRISGDKLLISAASEAQLTFSKP